VVADFPENIGLGIPTELKNVKSIDLGSMRLKSLSQSAVNATFSVVLNLSLYISKEDYDASQEVRNYVGEHDDDFSGIYMDTNTRLELCFEFELLSQPPMVLSSKLRTVGGNSTTYQFN
jgi:hypothetical protein